MRVEMLALVKRGLRREAIPSVSRDSPSKTDRRCFNRACSSLTCLFQLFFCRASLEAKEHRVPSLDHKACEKSRVTAAPDGNADRNVSQRRICEILLGEFL